MNHLRCVFLLNILDSASSFNTSNSKARRVWKTTHNSGLPLQRTLYRLIEFRRLTQVDDVDISICCAHNQEILLYIQSIDSLLTCHSSNRLTLSQIPVLDGLIPRAGHDHRGVRLRGLKVTNTAYRLIVCCDLGSCVLVRPEVNHFRSFVCSGSNNLCAILIVVSNLSNYAIVRKPTGDQWQLNTGASCSNQAFPSLVPFCVI